jgi:Holliday junction DNA helicase RuvB
MEENLDVRKDIVSFTDKEFEKQLRPLSFSDFKGQKQVIDNLEVFVTAER